MRFEIYFSLIKTEYFTHIGFSDGIPVNDSK